MNALTGGSAVAAHVSFDANWHDAGEHIKIRNETTGFAGNFRHNTATLTWSASQTDFSFVSDPLDSAFAEVGHERNGLFFK